MNLDLAGRTALVVGASRGIGRAVAQQLAAEGVHLGLLARDPVALGVVADEIAAAGGQAVALPADLADDSSWLAALETLRARFGAPQLLILSAAALYRPQKLHAQPMAEIRAHLSVDLDSAIGLCRACVGDMMLGGFGRIVGIGSLAARSGVAGGVAYATAKAALEGLMRGIALDYGRRGITANVVSVSFAATERLEGRVAGDTEHRETLVRATAIRRIPTPAEIAAPVVFLCSPRAAAITGAVLDATAGAHLNTRW